VTIPPEERDEGIVQQLLAERSGILNWCLEGLRAYHEGGSRLVQPSTFAVATKEYRLDADAVSRFLDEECVITGSPNDRESRSDLYGSYKSFVRDNGGSIVSAEKFSMILKERGVWGDPKRARLVNSKGETEFVRFWLGIKFKTNDERHLEWGA
jgi:putative DNA primase/helicase